MKKKEEKFFTFLIPSIFQYSNFEILGCSLLFILKKKKKNQNDTSGYFRNLQLRNSKLVLKAGTTIFKSAFSLFLNLSHKHTAEMERINVAVRARPLSQEDAKTSPWRISGNSISTTNNSSKFDFGTNY